MTFGAWVRTWLDVLELSQSWFYFASGVSDGSINRWEKGQSVRMDIFTVCCEVLADAAQVPFEEMVTEALHSIPEYRYALRRGDA